MDMVIMKETKGDERRQEKAKGMRFICCEISRWIHELSFLASSCFRVAEVRSEIVFT